MKFLILLLIYVISGILTISAKSDVIDNIVAVVNNKIILDSDVNKVLSMFRTSQKDIQIPFNDNYLRKKVIKKLILDSIILEKADQKNIIVTKQQVDEAIKNIAFQKNMTLNDFKNSKFFNNSIFNYQDYCENIKNSLKIEILKHYELMNRAHVSKNDVNLLFYNFIKENNRNNKIHLSYIFFPFKKHENQERHNNQIILVNSIVKKIKKYNHFMFFYNECMKHKNIFSVKTIPWTDIKSIQKNFSNTLNIIKSGDIIGPLHEKNGLYILKINGIRNQKSKFVKTFHIAHCLIKFSSNTEKQLIKNKAFEIYNNIKNKVYNFEYAVKHFSNDVYSSNKKGDIGWVSFKLLDKNFKKLLINLKKDSIGYPIESDIGWHIIKVLNKNNVDEYYLKQKYKAYKILLNQKIISENKKWINELNRSSYINVLER